jgi:hypothetical protein
VAVLEHEQGVAMRINWILYAPQYHAVMGIGMIVALWLLVLIYRKVKGMDKPELERWDEWMEQERKERLERDQRMREALDTYRNGTPILPEGNDV